MPVSLFHRSGLTKIRALAASLAALAMAGCACGDLDRYLLDEMAYWDSLAGPRDHCGKSGLGVLSRTASEWLNLADPHLLALAKRDAERHCLQTARLKSGRSRLQAKAPS